MAVKMNDLNRTIGAIDAAEQRQGNGVVTTQSDDTWQSLALQGWSLCVSIGSWLPRQQLVVSFIDLFESIGIVVSGKLSVAGKNFSRTYDVTGISPQSIMVAHS